MMVIFKIFINPSYLIFSLEYECFDTDFYFFNSMPLPPSFHEYYEENKVKADARVMKGILPEINCVYLFIDKSLYLWKFMEDIGNADNMHSSNIYNPENDRNQAKVFSFGPYEEEIRAVNVCKPTAHVFIQADIKMVFIIGFATSIKLYNLLFDEKTIALESLEVTVKINAEIEMVALNFINFINFINLCVFYILFRFHVQNQEEYFMDVRMEKLKKLIIKSQSFLVSFRIKKDFTAKNAKKALNHI